MRAIDADALREQFPEPDDWRDPERALVHITGIWAEIDNAPTIEPERKKGEWIEQDDAWDGVYYECSVCKEPFTLIDGTPSENLYNFCPNCGADMREDQDG